MHLIKPGAFPGVQVSTRVATFCDARHIMKALNQACARWSYSVCSNGAEAYWQPEKEPALNMDRSATICLIRNG